MLINLRATINKRRAAGLEDEKDTDDSPVEPNVPIEPTEGEV